MLTKENTFTHLADLFSALSDPTRLRIISVLLEGELNVGDIASQLGMTESAVSHQLRGLRQLHLVRSRKDGRQVYYAVDDDHVDLFVRARRRVLRRGGQRREAGQRGQDCTGEKRAGHGNFLGSK